jgi:hypothetical protein
MNTDMAEDPRLRATEEQMRRALGLHDAAAPRQSFVQAPAPSPGTHRPPRRFARDGDVPVTVVGREHRPDDASGVNQLQAARQAIRTQAVARERAERELADAQTSVRDLQTKLAHERMARDEALRHAEDEKRALREALDAAQADLATERDARRRAEQRLAEAVEAATRPAPLAVALAAPELMVPPKERAKPGRKPRAKPAQEDEAQSDFVEWWVPGWQEKFR